MVTFILMSLAGLTLNIMTLGGLALGIGLLIDSTIIMLENITRHQHQGEKPFDAAVNAATEINSAIVASTSTNLAAILPFLFVSGLVGLLFSELIYTLSAAISASLIVALTVVPSLGARVIDKNNDQLTFTGKVQNKVEAATQYLRARLAKALNKLLLHPWQVVAIFVIGLTLPIYFFFYLGKQTFLPSVDEGEIRVAIKADAGVQFYEMDNTLLRIERLIRQQPEVDQIFTLSGGRIFGRTERLSSNIGSIDIKLYPQYRSETWVKKMEKQIKALNLVGYTVRLTPKGVRGIRISQGDDDISIRVQGNDLETLTIIGNEIVERLHGVQGVRNLEQTYEELREELVVDIDRDRAADVGVSVTDIGTALRVALEGEIISDYQEGDRKFNIRLRLPTSNFRTPNDLETIAVGINNGKPIRLGSVAQVRNSISPSTILRDNQRRIVEISASLTKKADLRYIADEFAKRLSHYQLPEGYNLYDSGATKTLKEGQSMGFVLLMLALFLVYVVMAVQYESLLNPLIIMISIFFTPIGVAIGLMLYGLPEWLTTFSDYQSLPISMPVWLGLIMLAGIVVNNAIVLVEQIEIEREKGMALRPAIIHAAELRLRPILMTTLTTVVGMLPLAIGIGRGSEMLQPLALVIVWGLSFSVLVSLALVPVLYELFHARRHTPAVQKVMA